MIDSTEAILCYNYCIDTMEVNVYMKMKTMIAIMLVLALIAIGMGVWAFVSYTRVGELSAQVVELEEAMNAVVEEETIAVIANPDAIAAEFNGGTVSAAEAAAEYALISGYYQMMGMNEAEYAENAKYSVIDGLVEAKVLEMKAREAGVYELTDERKAQIEAQVKAEYEDNIEYYMAFRFDDSKSDAEVREETIAYLNESGYSYEQMLFDAQQNAWRDALYDHVTKDMVIEEAQLREFYETQVTTDEMTYQASFMEYELDAEAGRTIVWHPAGVRNVEYFQIGFDDNQAIEYLSLQAAIEGGDTAKQAELDALYAQLDERAQAALSRIQGGEDFANVAAEFGGVYSSVVAEQSTFRGEDFRDAALALENVGDVSGVVRSDGGVCILRYVGDVPEGKVPFEDVAEELRANYEVEIKSSLYNATVLQWMDEANIQYHLDTF